MVALVPRERLLGAKAVMMWSPGIDGDAINGSMNPSMRRFEDAI
jgi:hypothetical protein